MGAVYQGVDLMVEREVAIKMLRPEIARQPDIVERFRAEAVALAKLNHPNIATLYSFFREGDEYFMVMEFVVGRTLESIMQGSPPISAEAAIAISSQVLDAIEHAHSYGILHRDIKPANIMLTGSGQVKVTDFGIARVLGKARMTREGTICGTLEYLAPERIRGQEGDIRSDLYSMGIVLYEMLSSHLPFERDSEYELMRAHLQATPPSFASLGLPSVPPKLEMVVSKALAKLPEQRFGTAGEFRSALAHATKPVVEPAALTGEPGIFAESPALAPAAPAALTAVPAVATPAALTTNHRKVYAAVGAVLVLMAMIFGLLWSRKHQAVEGTRAAPTPVVAQPSTPVAQPTPPTAQPEAAGQINASPASPAPEEHTQVQDGSKTRPTSKGRSAALPAANAVKSNAPVENAPDIERRKAALKALEKGDSATGSATKKKETERDRRSSSLDALKK